MDSTLHRYQQNSQTGIIVSCHKTVDYCECNITRFLFKIKGPEFDLNIPNTV